MRQQDMFNGTGQPFEAWSQMWFGAFGNAQKSIEPVTKNLATAQSEVTSFASRRTQAWLDLPKQFANCKAPQDFAQANMQFLQSAASDWTASSQRMMALWGASMPTSSSFATPRDHVVPDATDARRVMDQNTRPNDRTNDPNGRRAAA
jgi:Phasin protein